MTNLPTGHDRDSSLACYKLSAGYGIHHQETNWYEGYERE